jgi:hypothetical protein
MQRLARPGRQMLSVHESSVTVQRMMSADDPPRRGGSPGPRVAINVIAACAALW